MSENHHRGLQVKEAIITLCRIFKYSGVFESVTPDDIRLSKFDKPEVVEILSKLLQKLLKIPESSHGLQICAKMQLFQYPRSKLLISSNGPGKSSRELLLAIAWYIHVTKFIDQTCDHACQPADIKTLFKTKQMTLKNVIDREEDSLSTSEKLYKLTWSVSQLSLLKKQLISAKVATEITKAKLTMGLASEFQDDPLLLLAMKTPSKFTEYENLLEKKIYLLQSCIQWRKQQAVFWRWMDSVLALAPQFQDADNGLLQEMSDDGSCNSIKSELQRKINCLERKILDERLLYPKRTFESSSSLLTPEMKLNLSKEIIALRARLHNPYHCPRITQRGHELASSDSSVSMESEIERLTDINHQQLKRIRELQCKAQAKIETFCEMFTGIVLVPPNEIKRAAATSIEK